MIFPRKKAVRILTRVLSDRQSLEDALATATRDCTSEEAGWLQEVCSGTIRWRGRLDFILDSIALKKKPTGWLRKILLIACYQLVVQDRVHPGSIVSETVAEIKLTEGEAPARFANASLRKVADHALQWRNLAFPVGKNAPSDAALQAAWAGLPLWLWNKLVAQHGLEWSKAYALASFQRPSLWVRTRNPERPLEWHSIADAPAPGGVESRQIFAGPIAGSWQIQGITIPQLPGFQAGEFLVQDISNQILISEACASITATGAGLESLAVLDLCAAPGGKSIGMAWNKLNVMATDHSAARAELLKSNIARLAPQIEVIPWDQIPRVELKDVVWLDAPCSGTGIIRRHPDIRWLREEKQLVELTKTQMELVRLAWEKVRPGGFFIYSVCSVLKDEGVHIIKKAQLEQYVMKEWFLYPHSELGGDGFWGGLFHKPLSS